MALRLPLEFYSTSGAGPLDLEVDLDDEGGRVVLVVNVEPFETLRTSRIRPSSSFEPELPKIAEPMTYDAPELENRNRELVAALEDARRRIEARREEADYLRDLLEHVEDSVDRHLLPEEARALAAALVHYAKEATR